MFICFNRGHGRCTLFSDISFISVILDSIEAKTDLKIYIYIFFLNKKLKNILRVYFYRNVCEFYMER